MKTKWQRQITAVIEALKEGAKKCEQTTGTLFKRAYYDGEKPQACALGAIYVDGKTVSRIRFVKYDRVYREHPVLKTEAGADDWSNGESLSDRIIDLNDGQELSFREIIVYLRKLARRKTVPSTWPEAA